MTEIKIGLTATAIETVLYTNIASALGSGNLSVYATPAMVALMEKAACNILNPYLESDSSSVGVSMDITHDAATLPGKIITATAELVEVDGRKLTFKVSAQDEYGIIGKGIHRRFIVNKEKFITKLKNKESK
jgi:fluoroacetyl-CoA thioesterase